MALLARALSADENRSLAPGDLLDRFGSDPADRPGIALRLSGGGDREMFSRVASLGRLSEPSCLPKLARASSVSAGSIRAGVVSLNWRRIHFQDERRICLRTGSRRRPEAPGLAIDRARLIYRDPFRGVTVGDRTANAYRKHSSVSRFSKTCRRITGHGCRSAEPPACRPQQASEKEEDVRWLLLPKS